MPRFSVKFLWGVNCSITYDSIIKIEFLQRGVRIVDDDYWSTVVLYEDFNKFEVEIEIENDEWS